MPDRTTPPKKTPKKKAAKKKAAKKKSARARKPPPKKKTAKKKTTKKKAARKKPGRQRSTKGNRNQPRTAGDPVPDHYLPAIEDDEIQIWESYARLRSRVLVAADLGLSEYRVRQVIDADRPRLRRVIDDYLELVAAEKEQIERTALAMLYRLLRLYDRQIAEIERAAEADGVTNIPNEDGVPMPVPQAIDSVVTSKGFLQLISAITAMRKDIGEYRTKQASHDQADDPAKPADGVADFADMSPAELAEELERAGVPMPGVLGRLRKHVENTAQASS